MRRLASAILRPREPICEPAIAEARVQMWRGLLARTWTLDIVLKCRLWCEPLACTRRTLSPSRLAAVHPRPQTGVCRCSELKGPSGETARLWHLALDPALHYGGQGLALRRARPAWALARAKHESQAYACNIHETRPTIGRSG